MLGHEHLLIDIRCWLDETHAPSRHLRDRRVSAETLPEVRNNPFACLDNLVLDDAELMTRELTRVGEGALALVVDVTPQNVGRDVEAIAAISTAAGVDVVLGCGRYIAESRPDDGSLTAEDYRDEILREFDGTPRPAVIGEIGTSDPIAESERRSLAGAAEAQRELGVPLYVHLDPWGRNGHDALDVVAAAGGELTKVVLCHLDPAVLNGLDYHRSLMDRGATIAFDLWGDEWVYGAVRMPTDRERLDAVVALAGEGYGDRLVHSHDVCTKTQLHAFGGAGFGHIGRVVVPMLASSGLGPDEVRRQLAGNALALLRGSAP